jgi:ferric-dicitrate binding protein FerR (iron transport regulator)
MKNLRQVNGIYELTETLTKQQSIDTAKAWNKVSRKIAYLSFRKRAWNFSCRAAVILLILGLLYQFIIQPMLDTAPIESITLSSAPGIVTKVILPDGSEVWLNSQSELTYPIRFTGKERRVELSGEAYFKVIADQQNRFNVATSDNITVSAYGTEFNVSAYPNASECQVTLTEGNVNVAVEAERPVTKELSVGQKLVLSRLTGQVNVVETDTYVDTAWKDGKMVFRRENLETIVYKLSRKFGVTIYLEDDVLKEYEYTATFTNETLEDILELLKRSAPITYSISDREQLGNDTFSRRVVTICTR